jgi:molecular chaperone GrpE
MRKPRAKEEAEAAARAARAPEDAGGDAALRAEVDRLEAERDELRKQYDELYDKHLRAHADFDNLRKRILKERAEEGSRAQAELLTEILDPLDDLRRAIEADAVAPEARPLLDGVRLVHDKLLSALSRLGLEPIDAEGARFDPEWHEAVLTVPAETPDEDGRVVQVLARGYRFGGRLLRPARVTVKRYAPELGDEGGGADAAG